MLAICNKAHMKITGEEVFTAGAQKVFTVDFQFDKSWDGLEKIAVFKCGNIEKAQVLSNKFNCEVPWEALIAGKYLQLGVYGCNAQGVVVPTVWCTLGYVNKATTTPEELAGEPTADIYAQILELERKAVETAEALRADAEAGLFDGVNGVDGKNGIDGFTPVKGEDYWTEEDKTEMVNDVMEAIPLYEGDTAVTPTTEIQILATEGKILPDDVEVNPVPYYETTNPVGGVTISIGG